MRLSPFLFLAACSIGAPLAGPDLEAAAAGEGPYIAVATHTRYARGQQKAFGELVDAVNAQMDAQPGFVGRALRARVGGRERWTLTVWEDEASLEAFAYAQGSHADAMAQSATVIDGVYSARWEVQPDELPIPWSEALDHLAEVRSTPPWDD
ncbi:MAG: DUF3291 domain-containing protein [Myxococcales bacterium]|nr:DUF3291 domain-containing protein [Myxococcales bacterium]MCB9672481.1 DUF3291 domain-containing protein [Alphaproteobacteria bacterium]MCB9691732.1 DUF3291 domain-containing protein [Alphaproteobacteria bacterium]